MFPQQTLGESHITKIANKSFESVAKFQCWGGTTLYNQNRKQDKLGADLIRRMPATIRCGEAGSRYFTFVWPCIVTN